MSNKGIRIGMVIILIILLLVINISTVFSSFIEIEDNYTTSIIYEKHGALAVNSVEQDKNILLSHDTGDGTINRWAVIIAASGGISYERHEIRDRNDVRKLKNVLTSHGWEEKNILVLLEEKASTEAIMDTFQWLNESGEDEDDLIIFFFSMHGYYHNEDQPPIDEPDGKDEIIHPWDPDFGGWNTDVFIVDDELAERFNILKSKNIVIIMHTCHAGGMIDGSHDLCGSGRVVLTSCGVDESSFMLRIRLHWMFSYYLIKGLEGFADDNNDKYVSAEEVIRYTEFPVMIRSTLQSYFDKKMTTRTQHPQMYDGWPSEENNEDELIIIDLG